MKKVLGFERKWSSSVCCCCFILLHSLLLPQSAVTSQRRSANSSRQQVLSPPVRLRVLDHQAVVDNGLFNVSFSFPDGMVTGIQFNGIDNLLEDDLRSDNRGYWDVNWRKPGDRHDIYDKIEGTKFKVIMEDENQVELSFTRTWDSSHEDTGLPLNIDKRFVVLRGSPGFYSYAIFERLVGWPDYTIYQGRMVFKLKQKLFRFMAVSDDIQRIMPTAKDRERGETLDYSEAVLLTDPSNPFLKGEVDDKYQYSSDNKDNRVHGWTCSDPPVGFWMITPSDEFRIAGPFKQDLTSHAGPVTLSVSRISSFGSNIYLKRVSGPSICMVHSCTAKLNFREILFFLHHAFLSQMFFSTHYAGESLGIKFSNGEPWKKVFGPVFVYLNSVSADEDSSALWADAKEQMLIERDKWPYDFPQSEDFPRRNQRGSVGGRLLVRDKYMNTRLRTAHSAYVGLAPPGAAGSWQTENKGYQFWTQTDAEGYFLIRGVRAGNYSLYAWVPGFIGDYRCNAYVNVTTGSRIRLGILIYDPPRNGPTLWEIGIPDRTAAEFFVPDPSPTLMNQLYVNNAQKFRQYGLWDRYADLYPEKDLVYTVGTSNYQKDWFFAHVNRHVQNRTYEPTTWQIIFDLQNPDESRNYTLRLALASANAAELQVRINNPDLVSRPYFTTGLIGKDNAIARHGIHGLYWLYSVDVVGSRLLNGNNTILLTQSRGSSPWLGLMYDYIRLEGPPQTN